jgi:hypothetical protein
MVNFGCVFNYGGRHPGGGRQEHQNKFVISLYLPITSGGGGEQHYSFIAVLCHIERYVALCDSDCYGIVACDVSKLWLKLATRCVMWILITIFDLKSVASFSFTLHIAFLYWTVSRSHIRCWQPKIKRIRGWNTTKERSKTIVLGTI